jgi:hypothetical protein
MNKKYIILILVALTFISAIAYITTQKNGVKPNDKINTIQTTEQPNTYNNNQLGFSFKYPDNVELFDKPKENRVYLIENGKFGYFFQVTLVQSNLNFDYGGYFTEDDYLIEKIMFLGQDSLLLKLKPEMKTKVQVPMDIILLKINNGILKIAFSTSLEQDSDISLNPEEIKKYHEEYLNKTKPMIDEILNSFKIK